MLQALFTYRKKIIATLAGIFFVWLLHQNIPLDGKKYFTYPLGEPSPYMGVWPGQGVGNREQDLQGVSYRMLTKDTLYMDIKTPLRYRTMTMKVWLKDAVSAPEIGIRTSGDWGYQTVRAEHSDTRGAWQTYTATLDITPASRHNDRYTALLRLSDMPDPVAISSLEVVLERESLSPRWLLRKIKEYIR